MNQKTARIAIAATSVAVLAALLASPAILSTVSATPTNPQAATTTTPSTTSTPNGAPAPWAQAAQTGPKQGFGFQGGPVPFAGIPNGKGGSGGPGGKGAAAVSMSVGQTITLTSTQGTWRTLSTPAKNGTASGTITFTVTGKLSQGYTLSLTGGTLTVDGTTYTVSSGTAQMGRAANVIVGQGTTTPTGQFLVTASARGSFAGTTGNVALDLNGSTEYAVFLSGTIHN